MTRRNRPTKTPVQPGGKSAPAGTTAAGGIWAVRGVCLLLVVITFAVFGQTLRHGFVNYDDDRYVYENPTVTNGLSSAGMARAFAHGSLANWDPLTTLSHMADCQLYGLNAGGHHLGNVLLHAASAVLLFLTLRKLTGALWPGALVAAVFAIHPLHVESVVWVSERKDTLSGFFFMLTLWAYTRYAVGRPKLSRYLLVVLCFTCGLMSKSMLVTTPFVLLLLDYWPLQRFPGKTDADKPAAAIFRNRVILEKLPLMALSAVACAMAVVAQGAAVKSLEDYPPGLRAANAVVSVVTYISQMFCPAGLAVFYPYPENGLPGMEVGVAALVLAGISVAAWHWRRTHPYVLAGWLWYVGMLVPVLGLIQAGAQAHADRYTYLPQIGLYMALAWLAWDWCRNSGARRKALALAGTAVVAVLGVIAFIQTTYWRDSRSLWTHTLACTTDNPIAHNNLGSLDMQEGRTDDAVTEFQKAIELRPRYAQARSNLGAAELRMRRMDDAITEYQKAVDLQPGDAGFWGSLGAAQLQAGRLGEAMAAFQKSQAIQPDNYEVRFNFGFALFRSGRLDEAADQYLAALALKPDSRNAQKNLAGIAWVRAASPDDAMRNGAKAVELAGESDRLSGGGDPIIASVLAGAYAEAGRFPEAVSTAQRALQLAAAQTNTPLVTALQEQLGNYQAGRPYRDAALQFTAKPAAK